MEKEDNHHHHHHHHHHHNETMIIPATMCLLEKLRLDDEWPETRFVAAQQKLKLLNEHTSEFPLKLTCHIAELVSREDQVKAEPERILNLVFQVFRVFFMGWEDASLFSTLNGPHDFSASLNQDIDTEDQVEVALRFFPELMTNVELQLVTVYRDVGKVAYLYPLKMMVLQPQARLFISLFVRLTAERLGERNILGEHSILKGRARYPFISSGCILLLDPKLENENSHSFKGFQTLLETGCFDPEIFMEGLRSGFDLIEYLLNPERCDKRGFRSIERSLRFFIHWHPSILQECPYNERSLRFTIHGHLGKCPYNERKYPILYRFIRSWCCRRRRYS